MNNIGDRVGAILSADHDEINVFGFGVYIDDEVPPIAVNSYLHNCGRTNPKIELDSGHIVWGCECWWGAEDEIQEKIKHYRQHGKKVNMIDPLNFRSEQCGDN